MAGAGADMVVTAEAAAKAALEQVSGGTLTVVVATAAEMVVAAAWGKVKEGEGSARVDDMVAAVDLAKGVEEMVAEVMTVAEAWAVAEAAMAAAAEVGVVVVKAREVANPRNSIGHSRIHLCAAPTARRSERSGTLAVRSVGM